MGQITVHRTGYGRAAASLLRDRIAAAKGNDPLEPVTVVVPTNYVGVSIRRLLASGELGPVSARGNGIAGLTVLTVYRLAELLGAPKLGAGGRRPVSTPVIAAAVRRALSTVPGVFEPVRSHPSTEEGLVRIHRELSELQVDSLERLAGRSRRAADVVAIHLAVRSALVDSWYTEADLMAAAVEVLVDGSGTADDIGTVLVYLPQHLSGSAVALLQAVAQRRSVEVVAGLTGAEQADAEVLRSLRRLDAPSHGAAPVLPPAGTAVVSVSDPEEEVRTAVARIVDAARSGITLERMAVLYPAVEPYARIAHEQLHAAGIPYNGRAVRPLSDRLLGRWLLDLLSLPDERFSRPAVLGMLAAAPMADQEGSPVLAGPWERVSREACVVRDRRDWHSKLRRYAADARSRADCEAEADEPRTGLVASLRGSADHADGLRAFVSGLFDEFASAARLHTWRELADWCSAVVSRYLGDDAARSGWPEVERAAADRVGEALDRLAALDAVEPAATLTLFRRTLKVELDDDLGRVGQLGRGVLVGTTSAALGVDLDLVVVLGLAEGVLPTRPREDSLLSDVERPAAGDDLRLRADDVGRQHCSLLTALAAASKHRVLVYPRGDQRRSIDRAPSRWLLDTCESLNGGSGDRQLPASTEWYEQVPSFPRRVATAAFPPTRLEYGLRSLATAQGITQLRSHPLVTGDAVLGRGLELVVGRAADAFTRFDGNLFSVRERIVSPADADRAVSASQLETWLSCPHAYYLQYVLRVEAVENPEELLEMDALERGSLIHDVLERWLREQLAGALPAPGQPWSPRARGSMRRLALEACEQAEERGVTGHPLLWRRDRERILADLERFVDADNDRRRDGTLTPLDAERPFGLAGTATEAVEIDLGNGRSIRARGRIDRIDRTAGGGLVVADYKTGGRSRYKGLDDANPLGDGTKLQLGIYGLAVRAVEPTATPPLRTEYWFTSTRGQFQRIGYDLTPDAEAQLRRALRVAVDGISRGHFPSKPPPPGFRLWTECRFCDPDDLGTADRFRDWERIRHADELADYLRYIDPKAAGAEAA